MMDLSIIVVSFNTKELLKKCLESILGARGREGERARIEVIVVENASNDGSPQMVKKEFPGVKLVQNKQNLGFAKANNQGIKEAQGEHILLLNSDTEVKTGTLGNLIDFAENHPEAGIVGAKLLNPDGSIQPSVYHLPTILGAIKEYWLGQKGAYEKYIPLGNGPIEVESVTGAAMLIPRRTMEKVGLLDERYFMYFEDLDYCRRVRKAGFKVYYLPTAEIIHYHGASGEAIPEQTRHWLVKSSKIYNGVVKYLLLFLILWLGQKWQKLLGRISF